MKKPFSIVKYHIFIFVLIFTKACEYSPGSTHFTDQIEFTLPTNYSINLFNENLGDTIITSASGEHGFTIIAPGYNVYKAEMFIDSLRFHITHIKTERDTSFFSVEFSYLFKDDGYYNIRLVGYLDNGSLPLRDRMFDIENRITKEWVVYYTKKPIPLQIDTFEPVNGSLKIKWKPSLNQQFSHYIVDCLWGPEYHLIERSFKKFNRFDTCFIDDKFIGGDIWYRVYQVVNLTESESEYLHYDYDPNLKIYTDQDQNRVITWTKTPFYNNFGSIAIQVCNFWSCQHAESYYNYNDTSIVLKGDLLNYSSYLFQIWPKDVNWWSAYILEEKLNI